MDKISSMSMGEFIDGVKGTGGKDVIDNALDITNCEKDPIHIPGSIQPHGVLIALREPALTCVMVSDNTQAVLGIAPQELLHQKLETIVDATQMATLRGYLALEDLGVINPLKITTRTGGVKRLFDGIVHRADGLLILELELSETSEPIQFPSFYHVVRTSASTLQGAASLSSLSQAAAEEVRKITGFDRVMIYRFDKEWNGEVIAEARREDLEPYLGLHYPASDIPRQARELYRRNWLRLIADVSYQPAKILPTDNPLCGEPLNLSASVLRSVSPIHLEYLKNMGVGASMSVSIIKNEQLWGLISCHHETAKYVPYAVRTACEFLGQILSLQIAAKAEAEEYAYEAKIKDIQAQLIENVLRYEDVADGLLSDEASVLELVGAQGAALCLDGRYITVGNALTEPQGRQLVGWLQQRGVEDLFHTHSLAAEWEEAEQWKDLASGVLALAISREQGNYLVWFRPEVIQEVQWGGNPEKALEVKDGVPTLHPRTSFAAWSQTVRLQALPWKVGELDAARVLRSALVDRVLRSLVMHRSAEVAELNEQLVQSNSELDAFAYIVSHDLKEPLRSIQNYALILKEDYKEKLEEQGLERINTLVRLAQRLDNLIDALLHYSRVGRVDLAFAETDLNVVLERTLEILRIRLEEEQVQVCVPRPLPALWCDSVRVGEVFHNLITNALKYNDKSEKKIEIGYIQPEEQEEGQDGRQPLVFYVRDNGIGVREKYFDSIFRIFKRLHGRDKFGGGTGAGLTIVKRIIERHEGKIWLESVSGTGTTFYFTLQKDV